MRREHELLWATTIYLVVTWHGRRWGLFPLSSNDPQERECRIKVCKLPWESLKQKVKNLRALYVKRNRSNSVNFILK